MKEKFRINIFNKPTMTFAEFCLKYEIDVCIREVGKNRYETQTNMLIDGVPFSDSDTFNPDPEGSLNIVAKHIDCKTVYVTGDFGRYVSVPNLRKNPKGDIDFSDIDFHLIIE